MPDADLFEAIRDGIAEQLNDAVASRASDQKSAPTARAVSDLAVALESADRVLLNARAQTTGAPVPPFDVKKLEGAVWEAVQAAGGTTEAARAAVLEIQKAAGQ